MTKDELVSSVYREVTSVKRKDIEEIVNTIFNVIHKELSKGSKVTISNFGTFCVNKKASHMARNPRTGETFLASSKNVVKFIPSATLKDSVQRAEK